MWRHWLYHAVCISLIIFSSKTLSNVKLDGIYAAFNQEKYQLALQMAEQIFDDFAGTPEFDKIYGRICLNLDMIDEAVFAFERAISDNPKDFYSRYLLALSYAKQNNYNQSELILRHLLDSEVPIKLKESITSLLLLMGENKQSLDSFIKQRISVYAGHDSNVNSGSIDDRVSIFGLEILLDEDSQRASDNFTRVDYNLYGYWHKTQYSAWKLDLNLAQQFHNKLSQYDRTQGNLSTGYQYIKEDHKFNIDTFLSVMSLGNETYQQEFGVYSLYQYRLLEHWMGEFNGKASSSNNTLNNSLDSAVYELGIGLLYFNDESLFKANVLKGKQNATQNESEYFGRDFNIYSLNISYNLSARQTLSLIAQHQEFTHHAIHPFFLGIRKDKSKQYSLSWHYELNKSFNLLSRFSQYDKNSSIDIYDYKRNEWFLGVSYEF